MPCSSCGPNVAPVNRCIKTSISTSNKCMRVTILPPRTVIKIIFCNCSNRI